MLVSMYIWYGKGIIFCRHTMYTRLIDWLIDWLDSVYAVSAIFQTYNGGVHKMSISTENGECMVVYIGYQCTNINE